MDTAPEETDLSALPSGEEPSSRDGMFAIAIVVAILALVGAVVAVGMGWRAIDESSASTGGGGATAEDQAMVSLTEFAITPATVGVGGSLHVMDEGTASHNLTIEGTDLKTAPSPATVKRGCRPT